MKSQRTCIGCRKTSDKSSFIRICRNSFGEVSLDLKGNAAGRGAYVCSFECFERAMNKKALSAALRTKIDREQAEDLHRFMIVESRGFNGFLEDKE